MKIVRNQIFVKIIFNPKIVIHEKTFLTYNKYIELDVRKKVRYNVKEVSSYEYYKYN